jgi:hypothetical protein
MAPVMAQPRSACRPALLAFAVVDRVASVLFGGDQPGLFVSPTVESFALP